MPGLDTIDYQYDLNNRVVQEIHSPGPGGGLTQTQTYGYVSSGLFSSWTSRTDERGQSWSRTIDANGRILTQTGPTGTKTMTYTAHGDLATSTDETGIVTTYTYSGLPGDLSSMVVDAGVGRLNLTSSFSYDSTGNQTGSTNARGFSKTMTFDNSRRVTSITENGMGIATAFTYDVYGNVISTSKSNGLQPQTTSATYSGIGDLTSTTDPMGFVTTHAYNALGQRISTTDPELRQRQFQYDSAGRLLVLIDANGVAEETRTYNAAGYLDSIKDARNNLTTISRDGFGRALQVNYPDSSFEAYTFDVSGNPLTHRMRNANVITNTFDALGRIATKSPQGQAVVTFSYDNASRLLSVSTPVVANNPASGVFSHGYDTAGRLISETNPQAQVMGYTLDANGNTTRITHPGGYFVDRVYDQLDRLTNIKLNGSANSSVVFGYDQLSRRTSKNYLNGANTTYSYDLGNNLLTMNIAFVGSACNWTYTYNKVHQMLSQNCSDTSYYWRATAGTVNYAAANNLNQYPQVGALAATYNTLGALATYNTWTYSYNTEQMLTAATKTGKNASFVYDPKLRQIQKTVGSTKTKYIYSGSHMMEERNGATNALTRRYVFGGSEEPVLQMTSAGVVTYIHHDHHGSVIAQSNATTGAVGNKYKYGPFGESAATLPGTTIGYTGQRYDTELGLYHYKARYFHQGLGRFLQPDPVGYKAGMNLYAYCSNDGLNHTDPDGLEEDFSINGPLGVFGPGIGYLAQDRNNGHVATDALLHVAGGAVAKGVGVGVKAAAPYAAGSITAGWQALSKAVSASASKAVAAAARVTKGQGAVDRMIGQMSKDGIEHLGKEIGARAADGTKVRLDAVGRLNGDLINGESKAGYAGVKNPLNNNQDNAFSQTLTLIGKKARELGLEGKTITKPPYIYRE